MDPTLARGSATWSVHSFENDASATPKPLRVFKRVSSVLTSTSNNLLPPGKLITDMRRSQDRSAMIPRRSSSLSQKNSGYESTSTDGGSFYTTAQVISRTPSKLSTLDIRKKRRNDTLSSVSTADTTPSESVYYSSHSSLQMTGRPSTEFAACTAELGDLTPNDSEIRPTQRSHTALNAGGDSRLSPPPTYGETHRVLLAPTPIIVSNRQPFAGEVVSGTLDPNSSHLIGLSSLSQPPISDRQTSFKHRFLNRLVSGLTTTMSAGQSAFERKNARQDHRQSASEKSNDGSLHFEVRQSRRNSTDDDTESSMDISEFETAMASFPTPPCSRKPSLVPKETATRKEIRAEIVQTAPGQISCNPTIVKMEGVRLKMCPEREYSDTDDGRNIFVAIEISRVGELGVTSFIPGTANNRLDVAIVIDNSIYTSPASLMESCETAVYIASILNCRRDRLAIICTNPFFGRGRGTNVVMSLSKINVRQIRVAVDSIDGSTESPNRGGSYQTVEHAKQLLHQTSQNESSTGNLRKSLKHLFILTVHPTAFDHQDTKPAWIQEHVICPGALCWKGYQSANNNGWFLREQEPVKNLRPNERNQGSFRTGLQGVISQARSGLLPSKISDLVLSFRNGPYCTVQGVMGDANITTLRPGEVRTILAKLFVGAAPRNCLLMDFPQGSRTVSGSPDLERELEIILGASNAFVMSAALTYKHSALPPGTTCQLQEDACLKIPPLGQENEFKKPHSQYEARVLDTEQKAAVQQKLIYYLATNHNPVDALTILKNEFGKDGQGSLCPGYFKLILEELKYQARITERFELDCDGEEVPEAKIELDLDEEKFPQSQDHASQPEQSSTNDFDSWWSHDLASTHDMDVLRPITNFSNPVDREGSEEPMDEAKRIWADLKRKSRGNRYVDSLGRFSREEGGSEETLKQLRQTAVRNKRSVGQETLQSLKYGGRGQENVAPWL